MCIHGPSANMSLVKAISNQTVQNSNMTFFNYNKYMYRFTLLILMLPLFSLAQTSDYTKTIDILPPSPNSASLGKFGGLNVGMVSGMANISVSLEGFTSNNLKVPISLNYSSNGLKVDEIASRVGMSWTLNAGGAITRTVMGGADDLITRLLPPSDFPNQTQNLLNFAESLNNTTDNDGQPDLFSFNFNGYSGQFMLDNNLNPVLLSYSALKIEKDFSGTDWNFKVTTPDGEQYLFGGSTATETSNKSQLGCGRIFPNYAATAWYLNKIIHPNRDTVNFTYAASNDAYDYFTGVNQTVYSRVFQQNVASGAGTAPPNPPASTCVSSINTICPLLTAISSTAGGQVKFFYGSRPDIDDKLLTRVEYYQPGQTTLYKFFNLSYQNVRSTSHNSNLFPSDTSLYYRPFLMRVDEGNAVNNLLNTHQFTYNNLGQLPTRLSFSQDDFGYYNGANNQTLIPQVPYDTWAPYFNYAVSDRSSHPEYSVYGTLSKVQYPTGGTDSLIYEGNTYPGFIARPNNMIVNVSGAGNGDLETQPIMSAHFQLLNSATSTGSIAASCSSDPAIGNQDPIHDIATISVIDSTANTTLFSQNLSVGQVISLPGYVILQSGHIYYLRIAARGSAVAGFNFTYMDGYLPPLSINATAAGLRISKVITKAGPADSAPQVKTYYYYNSATPTLSSGNFVFSPTYAKMARTFVQPPFSQGTPLSWVFCAPSEYDYYSMYSNPLNSLYVYPAPVYYSSVIESDGDNFANGGTEHHFQVVPDIPGAYILGDPIQSAPLTSNSWRNGLELYSCTFKMSGSTQVPLKKVFTHYKVDSRVNQVFTGYIVNKKFTAVCQYAPPDPGQFTAYDLASYSHSQKWQYVDSVTTFTYDAAGQNYVRQINTSAYGSTVHAQLTQSTSNTSDGRTLTTDITYPTDTTLTGDEETGRQALISNNMIGTRLISRNFINSTPVSADKISYHVFANGLVLPQLYNVQIGNNTAENRVTFNQYNTNGKLLAQSLINGPPKAYQWGYNSMYPVAEATNAANNDIFYDGFEEGDGNSTAGDAKTGHLSHAGTYSTTLSGLDNGTYTLAYWQKSGSTWTLQNGNVTVSSGSYTISLTGQIDDVRFYPSTALMMTYTFDPLIGMTSSTDAKEEVTYYEYDSFQRLMNVKDKDGNITKHIDYHYQGQ